MTFKKPHKSIGSALILTMILLAVGTVVLLMFFGPVRSLMNFSGLIRKQSVLKMKAESGISLAKDDLTTRAQKQDFTTYSPGITGTFLADGATCSGNIWACDHGLVPWSGRICDKPGEGNCLPRFGPTTSDKIELTITYIPQAITGADANPKGGDYKKIFPKLFKVISEARNTSTGERFRMEALMQAHNLNLSEITSGILHPILRPNVTNFELLPTVWGGETYFGPTSQEPTPAPGSTCIPTVAPGTPTPVPTSTPFPIGFLFGKGADQFNEPAVGQHIFTGPVIFADPAVFKDPSTGDGIPFNRDPLADVRFNKGYTFNTTMPLDTDAIFDAVATPIVDDPNLVRVEVTPAPDQLDVCLKFMPGSSGQGEIRQYGCGFAEGSKRMTVFPPWRYDSEYGGYEGNTIQVLDHPTILFCSGNDGNPCNLHVKGILKGQLTVGADNIFLEGDIQYSDQRTTSTDIFGAIAKNDIVVPAAVPQMEEDSFRSIPENPNTHSPDCTFPVYTPLPAPTPPTYNAFYYHEVCEGPYAADTNGLTNFIVPNDRDAWLGTTDDPNYSDNAPFKETFDVSWYWPKNWTPPPTFTPAHTSQQPYYPTPYPNVWPTPSPGPYSVSPLNGDPINGWEDNVGKYNKVSTLDLDGSYVAAGGMFKLEGFNDWPRVIKNETSTTCKFQTEPDYYDPKFPDWNDKTGNVMVAYWAREPPLDPPEPEITQIFTMDPGHPNTWVNTIKEDWTGLWWPIRAVDWNYWDTNEQLTRPLQHEIRIFGGLIRSDFSIMKISKPFPMGFEKRTIINDPRFATTPPPGFPGAFAVVDILYVKSYPDKR